MRRHILSTTDTALDPLSDAKTHEPAVDADAGWAAVFDMRLPCKLVDAPLKPGT